MVVLNNYVKWGIEHLIQLLIILMTQLKIQLNVGRQFVQKCAELQNLKNTHEMFVGCKEDLIHNQNLFLNQQSNNILICLK